MFCKNVIMLQAKNIDKSHDFEGALACCIPIEQRAAYREWDARSDEGQRKTRLHRCSEVRVSARDRGDA